MAGTKVGYVQYGAYALKASYQLNLTIAMGLTVLLVGMAVLGGWIILNATPNRHDFSGTPDPPIIIDRHIPPPPTVIRDKPEVKGGVKPPVDIKAGAIVLVDDSQTVDNGQMLPTQDEISLFMNNLYNDASTGSGNFVVSEAMDYRPDPDTVVFCEIYPEMIHSVAPEYPDFARKAGIAGNVWIKALVTIEGNVDEAIVLKSSKNNSLDEAAVEAAYKNKFSPAIQNGRPIPIWVTYKVVFKLD